MKFPFLMGFVAKIIAGFDDTAVHTPLIIHFTRTRIGKFAFAIGMFLALVVIIIFADLISKLLSLLQYRNIIIASLLFVLAIVIYFDLFVHIPRKKAEQKIKQFKK